MNVEPLTKGKQHFMQHEVTVTDGQLDVNLWAKGGPEVAAITVGKTPVTVSLDNKKYPQVESNFKHDEFDFSTLDILGRQGSAKSNEGMCMLPQYEGCHH